MSRMALIVLVVPLMVNPARAGLCELTRGASGAGRAVDFLGGWQACYVDEFLTTGPDRLTPFGNPSRNWDAAAWWQRVSGDDLDRGWYAYLDRGRYRFLDETQYVMLDGPTGRWWRWRYRARLDAVSLSWSAPVRSDGDALQAIPEPGTAAFLALGTLVLLRRHRRNSF